MAIARELCEISKNYKYAKGYNKALFSLENDDSDYYLLLNNDTICDSNILSSFICL